MHDLDVNGAWLCIKENVKAQMKEHIPLHKSRVVHEPPWMNKNLKKKSKKKKGHGIAGSDQRETDREEYRKKKKR